MLFRIKGLIYMWLIFCILCTILCGFVDVIEKKNSKEQPIRFIILGLCLYNILNIIVSLIAKPTIILDFNIINCLKVLPFCIFSSIGYFCAVYAFANGDISRISPILKSKTIFVLILSTIFLKEHLSIIQIFIIFLILILNILLTRQKVDKRRKNNIKGILFALGFLVSNGLATFLNKIYVLDFSSPIDISFYTGLVEIILILILLITTEKLDYLNIKKFKKFKMLLLMEIIEVAAILLNRYSLVHGDLSIITTISSCSIIITLITSMIVFKEKISLKKWMIILLLILCITSLSLVSI